MARKNFTQFELRIPALTSDFIVGYKADGTTEIRTQIQEIVKRVQTGIAQQLIFNESTNSLTITLGGNTISLSSLKDTEFSQLSSNFLPVTIYQNASGDWQATYTLVNTNSSIWSSGGNLNSEIRSLTGNWQNTYTTVQSNSSNWQNTYTIVQTNSSFWNQTQEQSPLSGVIEGNLIITQNLTAGNIELSQALIDSGNSTTNSASALYVNLNGLEYGIPLHNIPLQPIFGEDKASNTSYNDLELTTGKNGGTGFSPWSVSISSTNGFASTYINSAVEEGFNSELDTDGVAFGLLASPATENVAVVATRPLQAPLTHGNTLSAIIGAVFRSGDKGVILYDTNDNEIYRFAIVSNEYRVNNNIINWPYSGTSTLFKIYATQTKTNSITVRLIHVNTDSVNEVIVPGTLNKIAFYIAKTNGNSVFDNLRFNSLSLYPYQNKDYQQPVYNQTFANISANNITLTDANVQEGTTLTTSISSLVLTINGQQFKIPLLPL